MKELPLIVKIAIGLTFFNSWILFEEIIIDRYGLWTYLPYYRVGKPCVWDLLALLVIVGAILFWNHMMRRKPQVEG